MPRRKDAPRVHLLAIAEAITGTNDAAGRLCSQIYTPAHMLAEGMVTDPAKLAEIGRDMMAAVEAFRAVIWPEEEAGT